MALAENLSSRPRVVIVEAGFGIAPAFVEICSAGITG